MTDLTDEEIKQFATRLISEKVKEDAVFGIQQYGGGADESYIQANKAGLQMLISELLLATLDFDAKLNDKDKKMIPLSYDDVWVEENSSTILQFIEPLGGTRKKRVIKPYENDFTNKAIGLGCAVLSIILLALVVIGFMAILKKF